MSLDIPPDASNTQNRPKRPRHPKPKNWRPNFSGGRCGAWAGSVKRGCQRWPTRGHRRCRLHGGVDQELSPEGRKAISEASKREWAKWRQQVGLDPDWRYGSTWLSRRKRETAADYVAKAKRGPAVESEG